MKKANIKNIFLKLTINITYIYLIQNIDFQFISNLFSNTNIKPKILISIN